MSKPQEDVREDGPGINAKSQLSRPDSPESWNLASSTHITAVLQDEAEWLPQIRRLKATDIIILLTPIVIPQNVMIASDPFEPLGRLCARHTKIRHVPYTQNGITSTHLGFIQRGHAIVLCLVQPLQLELANVTLAISDNKPVIVVVCSLSQLQGALPFPTVIQVAGYSRPALEATAALIFAEYTPQTTGSTPIASRSGSTNRKVWQVEEFEEQKDMPTVSMLWSGYSTARFKLNQQTLLNILRKPGYAKHYVVRDPGTGETLGFCATYLSYVDREGEKLVASLAILIVHPKRRLQGIGLSLHSHAITQLKRTRGIIRLQLGSMFPRIPIMDMYTNDGWLYRRGWLLDRDLPGQGQAIYDLILDFKDWKYRSGLPSTGTSFRLCNRDDMTKVLAVVEEAAAADASRLGWVDQYWAVINSPNVKDIVVVAIGGHSIVGAALTYKPGGSRISTNFPWSCQIGNDCGGATCISISDLLRSYSYKPANIVSALDILRHYISADNRAAQRRETVLGGLINACVENLRGQGMTRLFLDGVTGNPSDLIDLGFQEWTSYRGVWKDI